MLLLQPIAPCRHLMLVPLASTITLPNLPNHSLPPPLFGVGITGTNCSIVCKHNPNILIFRTEMNSWAGSITPPQLLLGNHHSVLTFCSLRPSLHPYLIEICFISPHPRVLWGTRQVSRIQSVGIAFISPHSQVLRGRRLLPGRIESVDLVGIHPSLLWKRIAWQCSQPPTRNTPSHHHQFVIPSAHLKWKQMTK